MKTKIFLIITMFAFVAFTSCTKDSTPIDQTSIDLVDDNAVSDVAFDDVFNTVDNATIIMENSLGLKSASILADSCPVVTVNNTDPAVWPKVITVNFGAGCTGLNGNVRKGKIVITVTAKRTVLNATRTVTFEEYYFNDIKIEGTKEVKNLGPNASQNIEISEKLTGGKLTLPDGKTIERAFEHKREWIAGLGTKNIWDDECLITGTATGKNINGVAYTNTILSPLHWKRVCEFLVSGVIKFERAGAEAVELNYGDGECDAIATVTRGEESKQILLRHKHRLMP